MADEPAFRPELSAAIRAKDTEAAKHLFALYPEQLRAYTPFAGGTWLHFAAREGAKAIVAHLVSLGVDVNVPDRRDGRAPICDAGLGGHIEVVQFLIANGARLDVHDSVVNPLFSAIIGRSLPICCVLLQAGIDPSVAYTGETMKGMDAIGFALERGEVEIARTIAKHQASGDRSKEQQLLAQGYAVAARNNA